MKKLCALSGKEFEITDADLEFYRKISPKLDGRTFSIPAPSLSPLERQRRRLSFRNLRHLYRRTCEMSGRAIISCYPPESPYTIYHADEWWSDKWDALSYGVAFDFSRGFFEQFGELLGKVPLIHLYQTPNENCDYINGASNCKSCYLSFLLDYCEDVYYLTIGNSVRTAIDCLALRNCELCYECIDCINCYALRYSQRCTGCSDSLFLSDCRQCRNCIACSNLQGKEYYIFNRKSSRAEVEALTRSLGSAGELSKFRLQVEAFRSKMPKRFYFGHSNESFSGDAIQNIKNSYTCFDGFELENCTYCNFVFRAHDCMDYNYFGDQSEWIYESLATGLSCSNNSFCIMCWSGSSNNLYCHLMSGCTNCLGCVGLRQKHYCIFNRQFSKTEYERLAAQIIEHMTETGEWGEFFPSELSPFAFNLSQAQEQYPLTKEEVLARGLRWEEPAAKASSAQTCDIPDTISEVDNDVLKETLACSVCRKGYKIIEQELRFYRQLEIPLPVHCPDCRHARRDSMRNPRVLYERTCDNCGKCLQTTYAPVGQAHLVYCEKCHQELME